MNTVLSEVIGYLQTGFGASFKIYQGYVVLPPKAMLPCLQVYGINTEQDHHSTGKDKVTYTIGIRIVEDVTKKLSTSGTGDIIKAQKDIIDQMEERATGGIPTSDSVIGVLTRNIKGTEYIFNNNYSVEYDNIERDGFFYATAELRLEVFDLVLRQ